MRVSNWFTGLFAGQHGRLEDRSNNFTAIRTGFALLILAGHAIMLPMGLPIHGDFPVFIDNSVQFALDGFFILSGYMIAASLLRSGDLFNYAMSRIFRIFPGLIAAMLLLWLAVGPVFTSLPLGEYLTDPQTDLFPLLVVFQINPQAGLPGVFTDHPMTEMNGPLWTIRYELLAYVAAGILAAIGIFKSKWGILLVFICAAILSDFEAIMPYTGIGEGTFFAAARFGGAFMTGAVMFAWRDRIPLTPVWAGLLILAAFVLKDSPSAMVAGQIAMAYTTLYVGYLRLPGRWGKAIRETEDISYGIYILHWPIGQMTLALFPLASAGLLFWVMLPGAIVSGWLLRIGVEKPALALKRDMMRRPARSQSKAIPSALT